MKELVSRCEQGERSLKDGKDWGWSELILALKHSVSEAATCSGVLEQLLSSVVARLESAHETSPTSSSSSDAGSSRNGSFPFHATWWFEDLSAFTIPMIKMVVSSMVSRNFGSAIIGKFLFYYQKRRVSREIVEGVVEMLGCLEIGGVPYKGLFETLRVASKVNVSEDCMEKLVKMIGCVLDRVTLDDLLMPSSPPHKNGIYEVSLVLQFIRSFFGKGSCLSRAKKVSSLMDLYLAEIAPDPYLKPSKFLAIMKALPDSARDSFDGVYRAINLYLQVHKELSKEQRMKICSVLNYEKLSSEAVHDLTQNADHFPPKCAAEAFISRRCRLKGLLHGRGERVVIYLDESEKLKAHLEGMQWRASELESVCRRMGVEVAKMMKSRSSATGFISNLCL